MRVCTVRSVGASSKVDWRCPEANNFCSVCFTQMQTVSSHLDAATAIATVLRSAPAALLEGYHQKLFLHRAALVQHRFIRVLPIPLPQDETIPNFWGSAKCARRPSRYSAALGHTLPPIVAVLRQRYGVVLGIMACIADRVAEFPLRSRASLDTLLWQHAWTSKAFRV